MPEPDQPGRELRDMDVLPAGVNATNRSQWARVFRNQCDAHGRSHPSAVVLTGRYPAPLRLNPRPRGVLAISFAPERCGRIALLNRFKSAARPYFPVIVPALDRVRTAFWRPDEPR